MKDFIAPADREALVAHKLDSFEALWALELEAVDEPNTERGGYSTVSRLVLGDSAYYLKRQRNHLTRSLRHPLGEPTFARELRNIQRYAKLGIPALQAAFFAQRLIGKEQCAILLTRALDDWRDLHQMLGVWDDLSANRRGAIVTAVGLLAAQLHVCGQLHGCFYPKHIFLRAKSTGYEACLIDLEKTRALRFGRRDRVKDLETLLRRTAGCWSAEDEQLFISSYLGADTPSAEWVKRLTARRENKAARR